MKRDISPRKHSYLHDNSSVEFEEARPDYTLIRKDMDVNYHERSNINKETALPLMFYISL
jgi:hypothetical protein